MKINNKNLLILLAIIVLGLFLRLLYFQSVTFGYDQARDAIQSISIIKDLHPKIIGPTTDIRGLFHSPLYWYIVSPFYFFSHGDPAIARIPMILINICNIFLIYYLAKKFFNSEKLALVSALFMAVSFESVQYGRWLSNPPPALLTIALFFYGLFLVLKKKPYGLPLMLLLWGFSVDFQFFLVYQALFIMAAGLYLLIRQRKILLDSFKKFYWLYLVSILPWIFYIASEIKFKFQGTKALLGFFTQKGDPNYKLAPKIVNFFHTLMRNVSINFLGVSYDLNNAYKIISLMILILLITYSVILMLKKKETRMAISLLLIWLFSSILIYPIEKNNSYFLNIGNIYPLILLFVYIVIDLFNRFSKKVQIVGVTLIVLAIVFNNISAIIRENYKGETLFSLQDSQVLTDEKKVIDLTYRNSNYKMFSFNTLTNPLFIDTTWHYLYNWYGKKKYGYMPIWEGAYLDDFGKEIKFTDQSSLKYGMPHYMIFEPPIFHIEYIKTYTRYENKRSELIKKINFGIHVVEVRSITKIIHFFRDDISNHLQDQ